LTCTMIKGFVYLRNAIYNNLFHWLNQLKLTNQIWSIINVFYSFGTSYGFRILISRKVSINHRGKNSKHINFYASVGMHIF
jgi:hypothetical protein